MHQVNSIDNHFSVKTLRFFMRLVGMWPVETFREQLISDALLSYVIGTLFGALIIQTADLFYSRSDLHAISYNAPTTITVIIEVFKLATFVANRSELINFNAYTEKIFWEPSHNEAEWRIVNECNRRIVRIIGIHISIVQCVAWLYIQYMGRVENLFSAIMLAQTLGSILELCFAGFQILLGVGTSVLRTALSIQFLTGSMVLLLFFSWSSHEIIIESQEVAEAAYRASWYGLGFANEEKAFRQALLIIIARARKPCILTVGKFVPMSLDTFTSVFNTSISYFTILRQVNEEKE